MFPTLLCCVTLFSTIHAVPLWGAIGHSVTGLLAQRILTGAAPEKIYNLIPQQNGELSKVANWADQVRNQNAYKWSAPLHYADTPDWACYYTSTDCEHDMCVVSAIYNYTERQNQPSLPLSQRSEALKFFVHFVGDVHQPLHVGFIGNLGGNSLKGYFMGSSTNLHSVWDSGLINVLLSERFGGDQNQFADYLWSRINGDWGWQVPAWRRCSDGAAFASFASCPDEWADESAHLACDYAYVEADGKTPISNNFDLGRDYYDRNIEVVQIQLAKAGVRMANVLNNLYNRAAAHLTNDTSNV